MSLRIYGNRQLKTLPGQNTRPTSARVRSAVFNIWQGTITDCSWLDLCAGSGAMSAEALSRGAKSVICIEQSSRACTIIEHNLQQVAKNQTFQVWQGDILQRLKALAERQFDRIYFDPPYASNLYQPVLETIAYYKLLHSDGELAVEHSPNFQLPQQVDDLEICQQKVYGHTAVTFYCPSGKEGQSVVLQT